MGWKRDTSKGSTERSRDFARGLRHRLTVSERRLWGYLRRRLPLAGTHLRRQVAVGPYVADFCCLSARVIVEVDGEQHGFDDGRLRDERRTAFLEERGFRVLRFSNREVMLSIDMVLDTILAALGTTPPTPDPSPQGGGECVVGAP